MIVRKLTLERVDELKALIDCDKEQSEQFDSYVALLRNESIDEKKTEELYQQMRKIQEQESIEHEKHQQWLHKRQEKYAALTVNKQKLTPMRSKADAQLANASTVAAASPATIAPSTTATLSSPSVNASQASSDTNEDTATATSDSNSGDGISTNSDKNALTTVAATKSVDVSKEMSGNSPSTAAPVNVDSKTSSEDAMEVDLNQTSSSASMLSTLLQSSTPPATDSSPAAETVQPDSAVDIAVEEEAVQSESSKEPTKPTTATIEIKTKPDTIVAKKETIAQQPDERDDEPSATTEKVEVTTVESIVPEPLTMSEDKGDATGDETTSETGDSRHDDLPIGVLQDKEIKKEMLDSTNSNDSNPTKSLEEAQAEARLESSRRKRMSSVNSTQHAPTRRSGRFKSLRSGKEEDGDARIGRSVGSPPIASNSDSDQNHAISSHHENSNASFTENTNSNSAILGAGSTVNTTIAGSIASDERKSMMHHHSDETNDSISSDQETTGRGPPSRPLSISESIPNSPASSIIEDPEQLKEYKTWRKSILLLWRQAATHKYSSLFTYPVTDDEAKGYSTVVYRPIDLTMIRRRIENGTIRSTVEFQHEMMLLFQNAIMYNNVRHEVHQMAVEMQKEILDSIDDFIETQASNNSSYACSSFNMAVMFPQSNTYTTSNDASPNPSSSNQPQTPQPTSSNNESKQRVRISFFVSKNRYIFFNLNFILFYFLGSTGNTDRIEFTSKVSRLISFGMLLNLDP
jgi:bromodomain-containing protein 8